MSEPTVVQKKLNEASQTVESVGVRTRAIERKLRDVETLPGGEARAVLALEEQTPLETGELEVTA